MRAQIGYKVVRCQNRKYYSAVVSDTKSTTRYRTTGWTIPRPGQGPLAVFPTLLRAREFYLKECEHIFKVYYIPSKQRSVYDSRGQRRSLSDMPHLTRLASAITLVERVD